MAELTRNWRPENRERSGRQAQRGDCRCPFTLPDLRLFQNRPLAVSARAITIWLCSFLLFRRAYAVSPQAFYYLADATRTARPEDVDAARQAIAEAIRLDSNDAWFHALAGKSALETKQPANAVEQLKEAIRLRP